ncbi:hypothetical protein Glove_71g175 [Diversispora epigaea]|uniref:Uncharacterized protein n=1 Tax=Diversispora epigaea TaxID=1348612 RepID=A0A397JDA2_9GLOM|nr:hypothetical protein Glove_71g175 [Diversispora epigaea]
MDDLQQRSNYPAAATTGCSEFWGHDEVDNDDGDYNQAKSSKKILIEIESMLVQEFKINKILISKLYP